jgi:hypothetical protein
MMTPEEARYGCKCHGRLQNVHNPNCEVFGLVYQKAETARALKECEELRARLTAAEAQCAAHREAAQALLSHPLVVSAFEDANLISIKGSLASRCKALFEAFNG